MYKNRVKYFAYGSNMDIEHLERLKVKVFKAEPAILPEYQLTFNVKDYDLPGVGYANIIQSYTDQVEGILITTDEASVTYIDLYENFPVDYKKENHKVKLRNGETETAYLYIANDSRCEEGLKPLNNHLFHLLKAKHFISEEYYEKLKQIDSIPVSEYK
ncbi:gamma-glutamylcyclotransferase family protein [Fulvivirga sediminis]|uniref:Gamma-glutamylcyclotransferase n=1 Tax=Fulvivirga sediminis TaxID=2803949 RepID=A0A937F1R1_9BACT|nr:gamma-glutamylcyclotransferase family protein [Fulvivirga sediminis]MBL3654681.1 gamma-glutamylcyclotransferase [Fulvivirga sediminis]